MIVLLLIMNKRLLVVIRIVNASVYGELASLYLDNGELFKRSKVYSESFEFSLKKVNLLDSSYLTLGKFSIKQIKLIQRIFIYDYSSK